MKAEKTDSIDFGHMHAALTLARRGLGRVAPNPAVGCVIVDVEGRIAGRGWTQPGGRPHAETEAITRAGTRCQGATAYISLEPCNHKGKTPPCSRAMIKAGIVRAVIACEDLDSRVSGQGIKALKEAGLDVTVGVLEAKAKELNAGFFSRVSQGRPIFTYKTATTLDGRIATQTGDSQWITGKQARNVAHMLRARHDAILVGIGTSLVDDPALTCRLPGMEKFSPIRLVADSRLRLPLTSQLVETAAEIQTWVLTVKGADKNNSRALEKLGVRIIEVEALASGHPDPIAMAAALGGLGLTRILIEGGGRLAGEFLKAGLVDRLAWYHAPRVIGGDGVPAVAAFGIDKLNNAPNFVRSGLEQLGADLYETYYVKPTNPGQE